MDASVANAPASAPARVEAGGGAVISAARTRRRWFAHARAGELRVYQHSNLFYWWAIWAYGYACAAITFLQGVGVRELASSPDKVVLFHPSPWLGLSFIGLVLFVGVFTNVRARGVYSFMLIFVAGALVWGTLHIPGVNTALGWLSLLRVHLNLAFYLTFSTVLMLIWVFVIVFVDHFTWWRFSPGQVIEEHLIGQATGHAYNTEGMVVRRLPDDLFRHRVLGLGLFGLGTGDFMVKPPYEDAFEIHNVWRASRKQRSMEVLIATRITERAPVRP